MTRNVVLNSEDLIALILANLDPTQRKQAALVCKAFSNASRATFRLRFLDLSLPTRRAVLPASLSPAVHEVVVVWGASETADWAFNADADPSDEYDSNIWGPSGKRTRISAMRWHLARLVKSTRIDHAVPGQGSRPQQRLQLTLAIPSLTTSLVELDKLLGELGGLCLFTEVSIPQGVVSMDGGLAAHLSRCNALGHNLTACLSAPTTYPRLADLTVKVHSSEEAAGLLPCITPASLPALRRLTLVAAAGVAGVSADLSTLDHPALTSLLLHGITLEDGFKSLQQLSDLSSLSLGYEEDEGPSVNLAGDITALAGLCQLSRLRLQSLGCDGGLASLTRLTSLAISPEGDSCITVRGLPLLAHLSVDLGSESSGWDLLRRGSSVYVPPRHGLAALKSLELRCFVWRHWGADSGALSEEAEGGVSDSESGSDMDAEEEEEEEEEEGSEAEEVASDAESVAGTDDGSDMDEEEEEEEGIPAEAQMAACRGLGSSAGSKVDDVIAITSLEQRYLAALLRRLPDVRSVLFSDYMGLISPPAKHDRQAGAGSVGAGPGGEAVLCTIAGQTWERTVTETPIQGGISQNDITYKRQ